MLFDESGLVKPLKPALAPCDYKTGRVLGQGSYAVVKECVQISTGERYACKVISKSLMRGKEFMILNEIDILERISKGHPNIITLHSYFETPHNLYLIIDLCLGGELFDYICQCGMFYELDAAAVVRVLVHSVQYLHSKNVVHRDIKPENLLFREKVSPDEPLWKAAPNLVLSDFGLSKIMDPEKFATFTCLGTPGYIPPEVILKSGHGTSADMWSIGVLTYFLLAGCTPFDADSSSDEVANILDGQFSFEPVEIWGSISEFAKDFISSLLVVDPTKRLSATEALDHPWLLAVKELLPSPIGTAGLVSPTLAESLDPLSPQTFNGANEASFADDSISRSLLRKNLASIRNGVLRPDADSADPSEQDKKADSKSDLSSDATLYPSSPERPHRERRMFKKLADAVRVIHSFARHPILSCHKAKIESLPNGEARLYSKTPEKRPDHSPSPSDSSGGRSPIGEKFMHISKKRLDRAVSRKHSQKVATQLFGHEVLPHEDEV